MNNNGNEVRRAICYVRVSTPGQAQNGVSLDQQRTKAMQWCALHDYTLAETFEDAGISGTREDRPGLANALAACRKGDALVVYSLSRLGRSALHVLKLGEQIGKRGADLVSLSENLDSTTPGGRLMFTVFAGLGQFQRDVIAKETSDSLRHKLRVGESPGGKPPYGSRLKADQKRRNKRGQTLMLLQPDAKEQATITRVKLLHARGLSLRKIADRLTKEGHRPRGSKWYAQSVSNILAAGNA